MSEKEKKRANKKKYKRFKFFSLFSGHFVKYKGLNLISCHLDIYINIFLIWELLCSVAFENKTISVDGQNIWSKYSQMVALRPVTVL